MDLTIISVTGYQFHSVSIELSTALHKQNVSQYQIRRALEIISSENCGSVSTIYLKLLFHIINRTKRVNYQIFTIFSVIVFLFTLSAQADGLAYKQLLRVGEQMKYEHRNIKKRKVTGYTIVRFEHALLNNVPFILGISRNEQTDGKPYLQKKSWFEAATGKLSQYTEKDIRTGIEITNTYQNEEITTRIKNGTKTKVLKIATEKNLVPFEVLTFHLRKEIPRLLKDQNVSFVVYLPIIASELAKKGLPLSLSKLSMNASVESIQESETIFGRIKTVRILVTPGSLLISALLPKDKSELRFDFGIQSPYYLVSFGEGKGRGVLIDVQNLSE